MTRQCCPLCRRQRECKGLPSLFYGYQGSKAPPPQQGDNRKKGKNGLCDCEGLTGLFGRPGNCTGAGLGWWSHWVTLDPAHPLLTAQAVSVGDQLLTCKHLPQIKPKQRANRESWKLWETSQGAFQSFLPMDFFFLTEPWHPQGL